MRTVFATTIRAAAAVAATALPLAAQESTNRVTTQTAWSVFVEDDPTQCWIVSAPESIRNTRDGREVDVRRGDIRLFVSYWPGQDRGGEVSVTGGYPYRDGSAVTVRIGETDFEFVTDGEFAWAASAEEDARVAAAMRRGAEAVVTGTSARGTQTQDTFSLMGFTAAMEDAAGRCTG